ncbi:MAG: DUF3310 domain-containing protein [Candidatus Coprovivens sp.]
MYESTDKMVSHPTHYQSKSGLEVIDVIEAFTEELKGVEATDTGNIIKYACRWKRKNGIQDLEKIIWYAQHLIEYLKKQEELDEEFKLKYEEALKEYFKDLEKLEKEDNELTIEQYQNYMLGKEWK